VKLDGTHPWPITAVQTRSESYGTTIIAIAITITDF
jgi:hypothetical protein